MTKVYQKYDMYDFITDESFKGWVLQPTAESSVFWKSWIDSHPEKAVEVARAREFILSIKFKHNEKESAAARKAEIYSKIMNRSGLKRIKTSPIRTSSSGSSNSWKLVASIALLLSFSLLIFYVTDQKELQPNESTTITYLSKMTRRGEKLTLMLPDGSMVKLNSESILKFPKSFGTKREVYLEGEAFFEVERDTIKPFIVNTGEVTTEVLGTSFNVNHSPEKSLVQIAVKSGKVAVTAPYLNRKSYLLPTQSLTCRPEGITKGNFNEETLLGWKDGIIVFEDADMEEIMRRLSVWYDVDFELRGRTEVVREYSGKFKKRTLRDVLNGISYSSNFEFHIDKKKVIINLK